MKVLGLLLCFALATLSGCAIIAQNPNYAGPSERPPWIDEYYKNPGSYRDVKSYLLQRDQEIAITRYVMQSDAGEVVIDYFQAATPPEQPDPDLILVFPLLGGSNIIANYFADYFARRGFETALVNRSDDFKNPVNFDNMEELLRQNVIRDRIAMDYFEREHSKKNFGSFGISRGAINVAMTAGVDPRLKYNVMALGGSDVVRIMKHSDIGKMKKYRNKVMQSKNITKLQFFNQLEKQIKTDPKNLARYIDGRNTLLFLSVFDRTVPYHFGRQLRKELGQPETIFLAANHYTSLLFTQFAKLGPPGVAFLPFDFLEQEALAFYRKSFNRDEFSIRIWPFRIISAPFSLFAQMAD